MIKAKHKLFIALAAVSLIGCSNKTGLLDSSTTVANEQNIADLSSLMAAHPAFSKASLKDIKLASSSAQDSFNAIDTNFATDPDPSSGLLDKVIAKKAQKLIDMILDDFNLEAQLNADFKIIGIAMNLQRDVMEKMQNSDSLNAKSSFPNEVMGAKTLENQKNEVNLPTCEQIIENPFGDMPKEKITNMLQKSHDELKTTISGCAKIQGQPFVQCMEYFNRMAGLVNEHASCNMRNFDDLTKIAEKEFNKSFSDIQDASRDCMSNQFFKCGFKIEKGQKEEAPKTATPPSPKQ